MIFAVILAGGIGSRMGNSDLPKQFLPLGNKPILIHTIEKFSLMDDFEKIIVLVPENFLRYTKDLVNKYFNDNRIEVIQAGVTRNKTILNSIDFIKNNFSISDEDIILTHDAVRPFVTYRIIKDNIEFASKFGACDTVIPATDTIVESVNSKTIESIPNRSDFYQGQTPQSFKINKLHSLIQNLTEEEINSLTDACKIFILKNEEVVLVNGEQTNIKITFMHDLKLANSILEGNKYD